jgi:putative NADH-flavin reductase
MTEARAHIPKGIAVLGASGGVGRRVVERLLARGHRVTGQTRDARKLADLKDRINVMAFEPTDESALSRFVTGQDAIVFALGIDRLGRTTLFSETTEKLIAAMQAAGVRRLVAVTGIGAGETRGHGGFLYDRIIFPLFPRHRYADKDRQEALISGSGLDWTILRPAPFADKVSGPMQVHTAIGPEVRLTAVTRDEVAEMIVEELETGPFLQQRPFFGHA